MAKSEAIRLIANNKKAYHDYFIDEKYEAGIALHGTEVKSLRMGKCSIKESFITIHRGEVLIQHMHISPYEKGNIFNKRSSAHKKAPAPQGGDPQTGKPGQNEGLYHHAAEGLPERESCKGGDRPGPGQEAL